MKTLSVLCAEYDDTLQNDQMRTYILLFKPPTITTSRCLILGKNRLVPLHVYHAYTIEYFYWVTSSHMPF